MLNLAYIERTRKYSRSELKHMYFTTSEDVQKANIDVIVFYINWVHQFNTLKLLGRITLFEDSFK